MIPNFPWLIVIFLRSFHWATQTGKEEISHSGSEHFRFLHFLSIGPPERQERQSSPPRRAGRYRGREGGDSDEFLRMLGITPDEQPKSRQAETWNNEK